MQGKCTEQLFDGLASSPRSPLAHLQVVLHEGLDGRAALLSVTRLRPRRAHNLQPQHNQSPDVSKHSTTAFASGHAHLDLQGGAAGTKTYKLEQVR
jgi:hypothetical protein